MEQPAFDSDWTELRKEFPEKFAALPAILARIPQGARIFIGTGCGEPQHLVRTLTEHAAAHPRAMVGAEVYHIWSLGVAPYETPPQRESFRLQTFFIGPDTRDAVNRGVADYAPMHLSKVAALIDSRQVPIDVALIQTSPPDRHGFLSLGISVDITKAASEQAACVVAQMNRHMPRVLGDTFIHVSAVDYLVPHDEPLLVYPTSRPDSTAEQIGRYVAQIVEDGDTIQVGYGRVPNAILAALGEKRHLGVHTELLSDGIVALMQAGVIDNRQKSIDPGKSVASFAMGSQETYAFLHNNPAIDFRPVSYTNSPTTIARLRGMTAINSALQIDLTGQASAESIGASFYSGIGGQADFMRGALEAPNGKAILALPSTAQGGRISRIVPLLPEGTGVTLGRGDVHYVVTEHGIAYIHGKSLRARAMSLIAIADPRFREELLRDAKAHHLVYQDQDYIPGSGGEYPAHLEARRRTRTGDEILLRPVKIDDEPRLKDFFHSLSDDSSYRRFMSQRRDMPHEFLQEFAVIDYTKAMVLLALEAHDPARGEVLGVGQYIIDAAAHAAEIALVVRDDQQGRGLGTVLLDYLVQIARQRGLLWLTAQILIENETMLRLFEKMNLETTKRIAHGVVELRMRI